MAGTTIFLRDDDVGALTPGLLTFMACFRERGLPVSYQIIPALLTDDCAAHLREQHAATPDLIEFGQHGLAHEMRIDGRRLGWEFGRERDLATQEAVIAEGKAILASKLGHAFSGRLFTPPRHRFNRDTVAALANQGFDILSAAAYADTPRRVIYGLARAIGLGTIGNRGVTYHGRLRPEARVHELSISVAVDDGPPRQRKVGDVMAEIDRAARQTSMVGLMFHHQAWTSPEGLEFLGALARALATRQDTRFALPQVLIPAETHRSSTR